MRKRLHTTIPRVIIAILIGLAIPTFIIGGLAALGSDGGGLEDLQAYGLCALMMAVVMLIPGAPIWLVCHWRRAKVWVAAVTGGATGFALGAGVALTTYYAGRAEPFGLVAIVAIFGIGAAAIGAGVCPLMWWTAYPKSIQPPSPADVF